MNRSNSLGLIVVIILIGGLFAYIDYYDHTSGHDLSTATSTLSFIHEEIATTTTTVATSTASIHYGVSTFRLNEKRTFGNVTIFPWAVLEDSRCASDVQCIWAGKVTAAVSIISPGSDSSHEMNPGSTVTASGLTITLKDVTPYPISTHKAEDSEYRFVFEIRPSTSAPSPTPPIKNPVTTSSGCYVGGCSSQICSGDKNIMSTCEYRKEYACYQRAKCEKQSDGQCGWTETSELKQCLASGGNAAQ